MTQLQPRRSYEFGDFQLDPQRRVLRAKSTGQPLTVTGKIFDTLLFFVEHPGELLEKKVLLDTLWPKVVVEESNLTQTIHTLRRILDERRGENRFIVTVPGRGYRFVADVSIVDTSVEEPASAPIASPPALRPASHRFRAIAASIALALVGIVIAIAGLAPQRNSTEATAEIPVGEVDAVAKTPSVAVLPFVDMSAEQNQEHFAEGLSEEILNLLAQSSSMRIIARTSSFSFKDRGDMDIAKIARELEATHVLEGSVRKSGDRLRITAQLVDGKTSGHLWSQTYDRDQADVFRVQDEIAAAVSDALHAKLNPDGNPQLAETTSREAFEHYLHARYLFNRHGTTDIERARKHFEQALKIDPEYARAWSGLAATYHATLATAQPTDSPLQQAWLNSIERGLSLGPGMAETHVRAAQYHWWIGAWKTSDEHCKQAIGLNPSDSLVLSVQADKELSRGHLDEAIALKRRAVAIDPLSVADRATLGIYLASARQLEEAEIELRKANELSASAAITADLAKVLSLRERFEQAAALAEQMPAGPEREQVMALASYGKGDVQSGDRAVTQLLERARGGAFNSALRIMIAEVYAYKGDDAQALRWLEEVLAPHPSMHPNAKAWRRYKILTSPFFNDLRDESRWRRLMGSAIA
jgi:TolB-like protein/DNA-binding winged helix-turn-helix (wHTH) protein/Flp pilus assembly protein TadD